MENRDYLEALTLLGLAERKKRTMEAAGDNGDKLKELNVTISELRSVLSVEIARRKNAGEIVPEGDY
jgi:hypothetical protein